MFESVQTHTRLASASRVLFLVGALTLGSTVDAELITVGPSGSGCSHPNLSSALLRAAITSEADTIAITTDLTYTGSLAIALVNEANVTIVGVSSCSNLTRTRRTITTTRGDLFDFRGTTATIREMRLVSGPNGGRLITATGSMLLLLEDAWLFDGKADDGGNIHLSGGASMVTSEASQIRNGLAEFNGGGVYCEGTGTAAFAQPTSVRGNRARFNGGGIYASGCAVNVLTGTDVPGFQSGLRDNRADFNGGGIYATGGASVIVAGTSTHPATIDGNRADFHGGGIYVIGFGSEALVHDADVTGNIGFQRGGAFYVSSNATLEMDRTLATCSRGIRCSLLASNAAGGLADGLGGAIAVIGGGRAEIRQTYVTGNSASGTSNARVGWVDGSGSFLLLEGTTLYDNDRRSQFLARNGGHLRLAFVSAWGSSTPGSGMYFLAGESNARVDLYSSLVIEGNGSAPTGGGSDRVFAPPGSGVTYNAECVIAHELGSFPMGIGFVGRETNPAAVWSNPGAGDPHLNSVAPAIDVCDTTFYAPVDLDVDNAPRGIDIDGPFPNVFGPYDIGADEREGAPPIPALFADDFESGNTSAWSATVP